MTKDEHIALEHAIRTVLRDRARELTVPPPPALAALRTGTGSGSRRAWRVTVSAAAAVVIVLAGAPLAWYKLGESDPPVPGQSGPVATPTSPPTTTTLPAGDPPQLPFAQGTQIHYPDGSSRSIHATISALAAADDVVVARTSNGDVFAVMRSGDIRKLGTDAVAGPVLDPGASNAIWISRVADGEFIAHAASVYTQGARFETSATVPQTAPPCCDGSTVIGADQEGRVYIGGGPGILLWNALTEGSQEHSAPLMAGTANLRLLRVAGEIFASDGDGSIVWGVEQDGHFVAHGSQHGRDLWALQKFAISVSTSGQATAHTLSRQAQATTQGPTVVRTTLGPPLFNLPLPSGATLLSVIEDTPESALIETDDPSDARRWIRCSFNEATCEVAMNLQPTDVVPS